MKTKLMSLEALKKLDAELRNAWDGRTLPAGVISTDSIVGLSRVIAALEANISKPVEPVHRHLHENVARMLIEHYLEREYNYTDRGYTLEKQGTEDHESHNWAFWINPEDATSYLHEDGRIEWCGTSWEAKSDISKPVEPVSLSIITALRFYANGSHLHIDGDHHDFDTVSGEPDNLLFSGKDDDETMLEDGGIARQALRGKPILWVDGDDDETPKPIDGEAIHTTPQEPALKPFDESALYRSAISCCHVITHQSITLERDETKPGNALNQLQQRLNKAAFAMAPQEPAAIPTDLLRVLADFEQYDEEADEFANMPTTGRIQAAANKARAMLAAAPGGAA